MADDRQAGGGSGGEKVDRLHQLIEGNPIAKATWEYAVAVSAASLQSDPGAMQQIVQARYRRLNDLLLDEIFGDDL